jgi:hypothetical protein
MSHPTTVHDPQEFPEDMDDYTELSLSSEESDILISPPRSPSRLDFFDEGEGDLDCSEVEADADAPISRVKLARSFFPRGAAGEGDYDDDDDEEATKLRQPIFYTNDHCTNFQTGFEDKPPSFSPPLRTVTIEPLAPEPTDRTTFPDQQKVKIPTPVSRIHTRRLNYPHHGFSRSALLHQKLFWTARYDEWLEWQAKEVKRRVDHSICAPDPENACTCIDTQEASGSPSQFHTPPSGFERDFASRGISQDFNALIYPRVGDISALRDPYSENVDRCFFRFPLWTIHKTLYAWNINERSSHTSGNMQLSTSPGSLQLSASSAASSYEDMSRVADDDETDLEKTILQNGSHPLPSKGSPSCAWKATRDWEMNWYARWELLIGLIQRDQDLQQPLPFPTTLSGSIDDDASPLEEPMEPLTPETSIFHFAGENEEGDEEDEEDDDGTLVMNPMYSKSFEEGHRLAVNFFSRDRELRREPRLHTVSRW